MFNDWQEGKLSEDKILFANLFKELKEGNLSEDEIVDNFLLLILAGHETSQHAL